MTARIPAGPDGQHLVVDGPGSLAGVFVLPEPKDEPALGDKGLCRGEVPRLVDLELGLPPPTVLFRDGPMVRAAMPKAAIHVDCDALSGENHVSLATVPVDFPVDQEAHSIREQSRPESEFGLGVASLGALHTESDQLAGCRRGAFAPRWRGRV